MSNIQTFDYTTNLAQALLWEYNKATRLEKLVLQKQLWYDVNQEQFWSNWYRDVFNLLTANQFGLAVWSVILGLPLFIVTPPDTQFKIPWGFGSAHRNFNRGNFSNRTGSTNGLTVTEQRILLRLRYFKLTSRGDITTTNEQLYSIFKDLGPVYILDGLDMTITVVFGYVPRRRFRQMIKDYDLIPRQDGVGIKYIIRAYPVWGFGSAHRNFNRGNFNPVF